MAVTSFRYLKSIIIKVIAIEISLLIKRNNLLSISNSYFKIVDLINLGLDN